MIAQELEVSLHMAFVEARQQRHEFITVHCGWRVSADRRCGSRRRFDGRRDGGSVNLHARLVALCGSAVRVGGDAGARWPVGFAMVGWPAMAVVTCRRGLSAGRHCFD